MRRLRVLSALLLLLGTGAVGGAEPDAGSELQRMLTELATRSDLQLTDDPQAERVKAYRVPLGAMQKIRGVWRPETSERVNGSLTRFTWRVLDGFTSADVLADLERSVAAMDGAELVYECDGRACGSSAEWANSVFSERLLYGRAETQRYRVYSSADPSLPAGATAEENLASAPSGVAVSLGAGEYRLLMYASARSSDRQYLRAELLQGLAP